VPLAGAVMLVSFATLVSACVFPIPLPGSPVPTFSFSLSEPEPVSGEFTVTATAQNFNPAKVDFRVGRFNSTPVIDSTPPFSVTVDSDELGSGPHRVFAIGADDNYAVMESVVVEVVGRPNIVFVLTDDLDDTWSPYWDALPQTRALIADRGVTFTNSFAPDPICCPARAMILTGKYPHNNGVYDNSAPDGGYAAFVGAADQDTVATRLQAAGYTTGFVGKYLNGYDGVQVPPGWSDWFGLFGTFYDGYTYSANHNGAILTYGSGASDYQTDVLARQGLAFLDATEANDAKPFFLHLTPSAPHAPLAPAPRHASNAFTDDPLPARPNFNESDVSDKPMWLRDGVDPLSAQQINDFTVQYRKRLGTLLAVDEMVKGIVEKLEANGELDNTVLIFASDNGYNLGAHRLANKMAPYEESIRVPLAVAGPGVRNGVDGRIVTHTDFAPTILDLAGLPFDDLDGRSFVPLLHGDATPWRSDFLLEFHGTYTAFYNLDTFAQIQLLIAGGHSVAYVPSYRAVRNEQWLWVEWYRGVGHEYELYDVVNDPFQLVNLVATPEGSAQYAAVAAQLQARLEQLSTCVGSSCRN
jgi:arylsulfatase A-like enzyme